MLSFRTFDFWYYFRTILCSQDVLLEVCWCPPGGATRSHMIIYSMEEQLSLVDKLYTAWYFFLKGYETDSVIIISKRLVKIYLFSQIISEAPSQLNLMQAKHTFVPCYMVNGCGRACSLRVERKADLQKDYRWNSTQQFPSHSSVEVGGKSYFIKVLITQNCSWSVIS